MKRVLSIGRFLTVVSFIAFCFARAASLDAAVTANAENGYIWPLTGRYALTSTFAEYRQGHFHAGIDISTGGRTGLPVRAAAGGHVARVRVSPFGYGKALYIEHDDGSSAVYAHLNDFAPEITALVKRNQDAAGQYEVDIYPHRNVYRVARGDVIGFTGRSGCEAPHLHFELRNHANQPINPLAHGLSVPDRVAPQFLAVCVYPVGHRSAVNGQQRPFVVELERIGRQNLYRAPNRIRVHGTFSVSAYVRDEQAPRSYPLGPYRLETLLDEVSIFTTSMERFSYERTHDVEVAFDHRLVKLGMGKFLRQFRLSGMQLDVHDVPSGSNGVIDTSVWDESNDSSSHIVRFVAHDASRNRSEAMLDVFRDDEPVINSVEASIKGKAISLQAVTDDADGTVRKVHFKIWEEGAGVVASASSTSVKQGKFVAATQLPDSADSCHLVVEAVAEDDDGVMSQPTFALVHPDGDAPPEAPTLTLDGQWYDQRLLLTLTSDRFLKSPPALTAVWGDSLPIPLDSTMQTPFTATSWYTPMLQAHGTLHISTHAYALRAGVAEATWSTDMHAIQRTTGGTVKYGNTLQVSFPRDGVYRQVLARVEPIEETGEADIPFVTGAYRIEPSDEPLDEKATITFSLKEEPWMQRAGIYALNSNDEWGYIATQTDENAKLVTASIRQLGTYAVLRDTIAPRIWAVRPRNGSSVRSSRPTISAHVDDTGSGIDYKTITVHLDGDLIICEYDPFEKSISYRPDTNLAKGKHTLSLSLSDYAGNTSRATSLFVTK